MAGELGLKNSFFEKIYQPLINFRGTESEPGIDITLEGFVQEIGMTNTNGAPLTMDDIYKDLGVDPRTVSLGNILSMSGDLRLLAPEVLRDFINQGITAEPWYTDLLAGVENVDNMIVTSPWIKMLDASMDETAEAENVSMSTYTWGEKSVRLHKYAKGIGYTDELLLSVKLPLLSYYMRELGMQLAADMNKRAVGVLINGDQASGDSCAVVGVDTTGTITFDDLLKVWVRGSLINKKWFSFVCNEAMANAILKLDEFKNPQGAGSTVASVSIRNRVVPANIPMYVSSVVPDNKVLLVDPSMSMIQLNFMPLRVETDRIVQRQISATVASLITGWTTIERKNRIIVDTALDIDSNSFPTWMTPVD